VRKGLTDEWDKSGVKRGVQYAQLTDLMSKTWSGMTTRQHKEHKRLRKENLRDNMTNAELVLNMLAEVSATDISIERQPDGYDESAVVAQEGAEVARDARKSLELRTGKSAISRLNAKDLGQRRFTGAVKYRQKLNICLLLMARSMTKGGRGKCPALQKKTRAPSLSVPRGY
jgi:hypothetical protein